MGLEETETGVWEPFVGLRFAHRLHRLWAADGPDPRPGIYGSVPDTDDVGSLCKFIESYTGNYQRHGDRPPENLKGNTAGGFEELLMKEAERLEAQGVLTMARYPVASVMLPGSKFPIQKPSLPDFEGVMPDARQFIIEAKVCTQSAFPITKDKLKPKQVAHLLRRHRFGVPGILLIHFNERLGATFYDPPVTVGIEVKPAIDGGLDVWEKFAADKKGAYSGSLTRSEALRIGLLMSWHTPPRCQSSRPNLKKFIKEVFHARS